jgi:hypothetical protein
MRLLKKGQSPFQHVMLVDIHSQIHSGHDHHNMATLPGTEILGLEKGLQNDSESGANGAVTHSA